MKKNNCFGDFIYIVHASVLWHFHNKIGVYWNMSRGGGGDGSAQMQIVYDDADITLRFQDNKKNCRRIVTWRSEANRKILKCAYKKKIPLLMPKILKCCSPRCIFWKFQGGGGVQTPHPDTPSRSTHEPCKSKILRQHFIYWDSFVWADCEHYITTSMVILDTTISQTLSHFGDQISIYLKC